MSCSTAATCGYRTTRGSGADRQRSKRYSMREVIMLQFTAQVVSTILCLQRWGHI